MINLTPELQIGIMAGSILFLVLFVITLIGSLKKSSKLKLYGPLTEIEKQKNNLQKECDQIIKDTEVKKSSIEKECIDLESKKHELYKSYQTGKTRVDDLEKQIGELEEISSSMEIGFYRPTFEFGTSDKYKDRIQSLKDEQKALVKSERAAVCTKEWSVEGSRQKGKTMTAQNLKFMIRSFNNECDVAIADTKWNNYQIMLNRIKKAFDQINKFNEPNAAYLTDKYLVSKVNEIDAVFKYKEKKQQEVEEQRAINAEIAEQKREEAKIAAAAQKAAKEEAEALKQAKIAKDAYNKALKDFNSKPDAEKILMKEQMRILEEQRDNAVKISNEKSGDKVRLTSMAQHTKMGRVYILSNIGSFGENICKIGMTRAIDPMDRVRDLSGASVPFEFDCHAMISTNDAPSLENALHQAFNDRRVNLSNLKREHFKVSLDEIEKWLNDNGYADADFTKEREARTYRETLSIIKSMEKNPVIPPVKELTEEELFGG